MVWNIVRLSGRIKFNVYIVKSVKIFRNLILWREKFVVVMYEMK